MITRSHSQTATPCLGSGAKVGKSGLALFSVVFVSGASALIFETLLFRLAGLALGNSVWAVSIVLCSFMAGLAVGNGFMIVRGDRFRDPLRVYAGLEGVIGVAGLLLVLLFPAVGSALAPLFRSVLDWPWIVNPLRLVLALVLMLVPAAAMGATLPVLVGALTRRQSQFGRALGGIYGWNTLGAVVGALVAERVLVELLGIAGAGMAAATLNLLAAAGSLLIARRWVLGVTVPIREEESSATEHTVLDRLLAVAFLCGGVLLALEVIWFRFFLMFVPAFAWNLAVMLAIVLAGIGIGGLLASLWFRARGDAEKHLVPIALCGGALIAGSYRVLSTQAVMEAELRIELLQLYLMFPVSVVSGMLFTLIGQAVKRKAGSAIRVTGQVTLLNTLGAAFGSLAGGFLLIPYLGMEVSFFVLAAAYGVVALLARKTTAAPNRLATIGAVIAWLMTMILFPFGAMENSILSMPGGARRLHEGGGYVPVFYREGPTETIQYHKRELAGEPLFFKLVTNNHSMSSSAMRSKRYMKMFVYWPVAVNPNLEDALLISYGVGSTAKALTDTRSLRTIDVVDISRDILDASAVIYPDPTENPLNDPRVRVHVEDGRFFLRTTSKRFDLVTAEPPPPRFSGIVNLYSREYFRLVKDRLREGGIVTHWLPVYQLRPEEAKAIQRGFCDVFPDCSLWTGRSLEWMMVGVKGALATPSVEEFSRPWRDPIVGPELSRLGFRSPAQFGSLFIADGERLSEWMGNTPPLTDNHPQRLRSRPTRISRDTRKGYEAFMDDPAAGESFRQSPMIAGLWPAPLREAALDHFPARNTVNRLLVAGRDVSLLHETLSNPLLAGYASWAMGSDAFAYGIADRVSVEGQGMERVGAEILPHLAASAVVRNDYGLAARFLGAEAAAYSRAGRAAPEFCFEAGVYLHLIGGEEERAKALHERALRHAQDESRRREIDRFLVWAGRAAEKLTSTPN